MGLYFAPTFSCYYFRIMKPPLSAADRVQRITEILCGSVFRLGDRVWASTYLLDGYLIEGPGTIVGSRTQNGNPPFPYHHGVDEQHSILVRFDDPPHNSGVNNGVWTSPEKMRRL